jgi:hypothetical protein
MKQYRQDMTFAEVSAFLAYVPETGVLVHKHAAHNRPAGSPAGRRDTKGYLRIRLLGRDYKNHRLAWLLHYGVWPDAEIDHINGDPSDNRIGNLRNVSHMVNGLNRRRAMRNNQLGMLGVHRSKKGYVAQLKVGQMKLQSRPTATAEQAAAVYAQWKAQYVGF